MKIVLVEEHVSFSQSRKSMMNSVIRDDMKALVCMIGQFSGIMEVLTGAIYS